MANNLATDYKGMMAYICKQKKIRMPMDGAGVLASAVIELAEKDARHDEYAGYFLSAEWGEFYRSLAERAKNV